MPLNSMTAFARSSGQFAHYTWGWEIKSVNSKGLDIRCRMPSFLDGLDIKAKKLVGASLSRGSVFLSLSVESGDVEGKFTVNEGKLKDLMDIAAKYADTPGISPASLDGLLAIKGIVETTQPALDDAGNEEFQAVLLSGLKEAISDLTIARQEEGARMETVLLGQLDTIAQLTRDAESLAGDRLEAMKARFTAQLKKLYDGSAEICEDRLAQEIAIIAVKADICEEIDRLDSHLIEGRNLLAKKGPVGRKLDFLCQEFNREANTLCSKSSDTELTKVGVALKTTIDQFREQIQNIE